jgi:hypothetical protein
MKTTTQIRPHKVLGQVEEGKDIHALSWTTGEFSDFIFSFKKIKFVEDKDNDKLIIKFEYEIHRIPEHVKEYSKEKLEKELGDFIIQLLYYGLERDLLGFSPPDSGDNIGNN